MLQTQQRLLLYAFKFRNFDSICPNKIASTRNCLSCSVRNISIFIFKCQLFVVSLINVKHSYSNFIGIASNKLCNHVSIVKFFQMSWEHLQAGSRILRTPPSTDSKASSMKHVEEFSNLKVINTGGIKLWNSFDV